MKLHRQPTMANAELTPVVQFKRSELRTLRYSGRDVPKFCEDLDRIPVGAAYLVISEKIDEIAYSVNGYDDTADMPVGAELLEGLIQLEKMQRILGACGSIHKLPGQ